MLEAKAFLRGTSTGRAGGFPVQKDPGVPFRYAGASLHQEDNMCLKPTLLTGLIYVLKSTTAAAFYYMSSSCFQFCTENSKDQIVLEFF